MDQQTATLIAASVAAFAGLTAAFVSGMVALRVTREKARAEREGQLLTFHRSRLAKMKDMLFEDALKLQTLHAKSRSIAWLAQTPLKNIQESGHDAIARVEYALAELKE